MDASIDEKLAARTYLYSLFQRLFAEEPTNELADAFDAQLADTALDLIGNGKRASDANARFSDIAAALEDVSSGRAEYMRLFIGPGKLPAPPWESVWSLKDRALFTRVTLEVRTAYRASGFLPERYPQVSDDHLALETGFLAQLARRMQEAEASDDRAAFERLRAASESFIEEHLGTWANAFAARLAEEDAPLYATAARLLVELLHGDAALLKALRHD